MSHLDYQLEILRGQIEELQGRFEEMFALRRGSGPFGTLRGRSRRMRGKARQAYARARYGMLGVKPRLSLPYVGGRQQEETRPSTNVVAIIALALIVTAILWPGVFSRIWAEIAGQVNQATDRENAARTSAEL